MIGFSGLTSVSAQSDNKPAEPAFQQHDPIVEMLDSLVTLNHVIRFNNLNTQGPGVTAKTELPYYSDEIYKQRMALIYSPIPLEYNNEVKKYIDLYAYKRRELTSRVMGLSNLYFPLFEEILDQEGLPLEFKYLSIVESALNPVAVSSMGATGLWQFMYNTGKLYKLQINSYYDERRDPVKSTYAACQYFKDMYKIYGDWLLVIASYNCGPGNVNKAIKRAGGGKKTFWEIARFLPAETRGYVPAFIAVTYLMNHTNEHQIFAVMPAYNYFEVDTVAVDRGITLRKISDAIGLPPEVITYLNPLYKKGIIPDTEQPNFLRLPSAKLAAYLAAEPTLFDPLVIVEPVSLSKDVITADVHLASTSEKVTGSYKIESKKVKKIYTVRSGDNLSVLSKKLSCTVPQLKSWNKLRSNNLMKGQRLSYYAIVKVKVPIEKKSTTTTKAEDHKSTDTSIVETDSAIAANQTTTGNSGSAINQEFIYHMVQKGDTLWNIAQRYKGVTVEQIIKINAITNRNNLKPGTKLKVKVNG